MTANPLTGESGPNMTIGMDAVTPHNKQLQRTVTQHRGDGASAPIHCALAPRFTRQRAAAELRRWATPNPCCQQS